MSLEARCNHARDQLQNLQDNEPDVAPVELFKPAPEVPDYETLEGIFAAMPKTWYPALLLSMALTAYQRGGVFQPGGASELLRLAEIRTGYAASSSKHDAEDRAAADRLIRYYAGAQYRDVYGQDETGGGLHERDKNRIVEAYLAGYRQRMQ